MVLWDVQRDVRDGRIISIRPANFRGWGTGDNVGPLRVTVEDLGLTYFDKDAISLEKGGDGLTKTAKQLAVAAAVIEAPAEAVKVLTVAQLDAEIQARGYKPLTLQQAIGEV